MDDAERGRRRIVLAVDTGSLTGPALEAASALAARWSCPAPAGAPPKIELLEDVACPVVLLP